MVILPLLNTLQPSGQSVSLQAMSVGIPVMISLTDGFWDIDKFSNFENIMFVENSSTETWIDLINNIFEDTELLNTISKNGKVLVNEQYSLQNLNTFLDKQIS